MPGAAAGLQGLAEIQEWITHETKIKTLIISGTGGLGKTELACALVTSLGDYFFIDLLDIQDPQRGQNRDLSCQVHSCQSRPASPTPTITNFCAMTSATDAATPGELGSLSGVTPGLETSLSENGYRDRPGPYNLQPSEPG